MFPTKQDSNQSPQLQRLVKKIEISLEASLDMILSNKRITKALIRLCVCAGWSAPLLFVNHRRRRGPYITGSQVKVKWKIGGKNMFPVHNFHNHVSIFTSLGTSLHHNKTKGLLYDSGQHVQGQSHTPGQMENLLWNIIFSHHSPDFHFTW